MIRFFALLFFLVAAVDSGIACTMYKVTVDGKTVVGNNEDYYSPNSKFWFEPGANGTYGVMYMGKLDQFAQGAFNEAGLVFDGFYEPFLEVTKVEGKLDIPVAEALRHVMQTMTKVEEVEAYLSTVNLSMLTSGQVVFVDRSGRYVIIEGDEFITGDEPQKMFSNFYYSQTSSLDDVSLPYFQRGRTFVNQTTGDASLDHCGRAMQAFSQEGFAATQYSTLYDLDALTIRVHLYHDFDEVVEFSLKAKLAEGHHEVMIPELFSEDAPARAFYEIYNDEEDPNRFLRELIGESEISEEEFVAMGFDTVLDELGSEWLELKKNSAVAIKVFVYGVQLMPQHTLLHVRLGDAYAAEGKQDEAIRSYATALTHDPKHRDALTRLVALDAKRDKDASGDSPH